jgi:arylformamidase
MHIYKSYDQAGLNHQYNNRELVPEYATYLDDWATRSQLVLNSTTKSHRNLAYGELPAEKLDIYPANNVGAPTLIFIHGGYWQSMDKERFQFIASAFQPYDMTVVIPTYPLGPETAMDKIVDSIQRAINWIHAHIEEYHGDPARLYLSGHSAGGHLSTMMLTREFGPAEVKFKGIVALSGLYDLIPIRLSHVNEKLNMDDTLAKALSPVRLHPKEGYPLILAVGGDESDEYHCQTRDLENAWSSGVDLQSWILPGINHFSILSEFADTSSDFHRRVVGWMNE